MRRNFGQYGMVREIMAVQVVEQGGDPSEEPKEEPKEEPAPSLLEILEQDEYNQSFPDDFAPLSEKPSPAPSTSQSGSNGQNADKEVRVGGKFIKNVKDNKYYYIAGGVALMALIGFLVFEKGDQ